MPCCQPQGAARSWCSLVKTMLREAEEGWEKKIKMFWYIQEAK